MKKSAFYGFIALILAAAIVIACGVGSSWFTNGDIKTWFNSWGASSQDKDPVDGDKDSDKDKDNEDKDGNGGAIVGESNNLGISLMSARLAAPDYASYGISPQADTAYTFTATVLPAEADNKDVTFSVAWKNANSDWAKNKNISDYLTIAQTSAGARTATLTCLQPFGEPAIVTVISDYSSSIKATATVDYLKKLLSSKIENKVIGIDPNYDVIKLSLDNYDYNWSIGTLEDTIVSGSLTIGFSEDMIDALLASPYFQGTFDLNWGEYDYTYNEMIQRTVTYVSNDFVAAYDEDYCPYPYLDAYGTAFEIWQYLSGFHIGEQFFDSEHGEGNTGLLAICLKHTRDGYVVDSERMAAFYRMCFNTYDNFEICTRVTLTSGLSYSFYYSTIIADNEGWFDYLYEPSSVNLNTDSIVF